MIKNIYGNNFCYYVIKFHVIIAFILSFRDNIVVKNVTTFFFCLPPTPYSVFPNKRVYDDLWWWWWLNSSINWELYTREYQRLHPKLCWSSDGPLGSQTKISDNISSLTLSKNLDSDDDNGVGCCGGPGS